MLTGAFTDGPPSGVTRPPSAPDAAWTTFSLLDIDDEPLAKVIDPTPDNLNQPAHHPPPPRRHAMN